ncbi:hypothetical protein PIB30_087369 [Stylosanthes scabra]|uniref:Inhibitor I9 domain-containing protein n=1 Tax=Stylosanthes scabra TaxID=79078 RepID=A0ABU6XQM4_9FABA|nr:hypothetical protein [Stylosanthes scabra]
MCVNSVREQALQEMRLLPAELPVDLGGDVIGGIRVGITGGFPFPCLGAKTRRLPHPHGHTLTQQPHRPVGHRPLPRPQPFLLLLPLTSPSPKLLPCLASPVVSPHLVIVACLLARVAAAPPVKLVVARSPHEDRVLPFSQPASPRRYRLSSASRSLCYVAAVAVIPRQRCRLARPLCWNAFHGVAAKLSKEEAERLEEQEGVVAIFPERKYQLHTTRSPEFLGLEALSKGTNSIFSENLDNDVIVGVLDTGIWPESESFNDTGMKPVLSHWKGAYEIGRGFTKQHCNKKIVGARVFYHGYEAAIG